MEEKELVNKTESCSKDAEIWNWTLALLFFLMLSSILCFSPPPKVSSDRPYIAKESLESNLPTFPHYAKLKKETVFSFPKANARGQSRDTELLPEMG